MPWRTIQLLSVYLKLRDISQEDVRRALKKAGHKLSSAQVSRIINGGQGAREEYVAVIVGLVGLPKDELWNDVDADTAIAKIRQAASESDTGNGLPVGQARRVAARLAAARRFCDESAEDAADSADVAADDAADAAEMALP